MKQNEYKITFETGCVEEILAFGKVQATILAQAKQINRGHDFKVKTIHIKNGNYWDLFIG